MINVLHHALRLVNHVVTHYDFEYRTYVEDAVNDFGVVEPSYTEWVQFSGSVQPQSADPFDMEGTQPAKRSVQVWAKVDLKCQDVQEHCDQIRYDGKVYNVMTRTSWWPQDGWGTYFCTEEKTFAEPESEEGGEEGGTGEEGGGDVDGE